MYSGFPPGIALELERAQFQEKLGLIIRDQLALAQSAGEIDRELDEDYQKTLW